MHLPFQFSSYFFQDHVISISYLDLLNLIFLVLCFSCISDSSKDHFFSGKVPLGPHSVVLQMKNFSHLVSNNELSPTLLFGEVSYCIDFKVGCYVEDTSLTSGYFVSIEIKLSVITALWYVFLPTLDVFKDLCLCLVSACILTLHGLPQLFESAKA